MADELQVERGPFAILPEWLLDAEVSDRAVRLYAVLARYADGETGTCFPSRTTLGKRLHCGVDAVDRAMRALIDYGAVTKEERRTPRGDQTSNTYTVRWTRAGAGGSRAGAATPPPLDSGHPSRSGAAQNESQGNETHDRNENSSPRGDAVKDLADRITRQHWEGHEPRPMPTGGFVALRKMVEAALRARWTEAELLAGLDVCYRDGYYQQSLQRALVGIRRGNARQQRARSTDASELA